MTKWTGDTAEEWNRKARKGVGTEAVEVKYIDTDGNLKVKKAKEVDGNV